MRTSVLIAASLALHVGGFAVISRKAKQLEKKQTLIAMVDQKKKEEETKPPPKPIEAPKEILQAKAKVAPPPPPSVVAPPVEPSTSQPSAAMQALPDFGLNLGGGGGGTMGVPENKGGQPGNTSKANEAPRGPTEKVLNTPPPNGAKNPDLAAEIAAWKPKPSARVKPVYPDEARSAEIEGTVTVEAIVDCTGKVSSAKVLQGLGHGLDQAAITAIQKTEFEPAPRCAPGFQKAMKINYAFRLGD